MGTTKSSEAEVASWVEQSLTHGIVPSLWAQECWGEADHAELVCRQVLDITHDVKSFHFEPAGGGVFRFDPGQFLTLRLVIEGLPVSRCYTISSPPTRPHLVSITVKRVPGGPVSNWLHDTVRPGTRLVAEAPLGAFSLSGELAPKYLFLSGGSGITPLMSMTRTLCDLGSDADVLFIHSARTPADIIFRSELDAIAAVAPNVRVMHVCEDDHVTERWSGLRGRLSAPLLAVLVPDLHERETFTCGPAPYMAAVRELLAGAGYDLRRYHEESFSFETLAAADLGGAEQPEAVEPRADGDTIATGFAVEFTKSGRTIQVGPEEKVLDAALAAGLRLPSSCSQGVCGTCKLTKLAGEVDMRHNGGIRPREVDAGKILICCSTPLSDLTLDA